VSKGILFRVSGGLGKNIIATALLKTIRKAHPDVPLHVQASYPDAFVGLDEVAKVYPLGAPSTDFYDLHRDFDVLEAEPYVDHAYRREGEHIVTAWARRLGLKPPASPAGVIRPGKHERKAAKQIMDSIRAQAAGRPIVGFQWIGGTSPYNPAEANNPNRASQVRELPQEVAQGVVDALAKEGVFPVVIGLPTEPRLQNCLTLLDQQGNTFAIRVVFAVLAELAGLIAIDSFAQHAWAALGRSNALVLWGSTRPDNLGYETNANVKPAANCCPTPGCGRPETHIGDWVGNGTVWVCPHDGACMNYNAADIVKRFQKIMKQGETAPAPEPPAKPALSLVKDEPEAETAAEETKE
jgi:hypothetical protein